jgi:hypothetical protein
LQAAFLLVLPPPTTKKESSPLFRLLLFAPDCEFVFQGLFESIEYQKKGIMTTTCVSVGSIGATVCRRRENIGMGETGQDHSLLDEIASTSGKQSWLVQEFRLQHFENKGFDWLRSDRFDFVDTAE